MAIITQCPKCGKKLKAPEAQIGKTAKCPQCRQPFAIQPIDKAPAADKQPAARQAAAVAAQKTPAPVPKRPVPAGGGAPQPREDWFMQAADGEEYGPVSRAELDEWLAEGRIDAECQLLREGWDQWKWAEEVFPELRADGGADAPPAEADAAEEDNPFAGLGAPQSVAASRNPYASPSTSGGGSAAAESGEGGVTRGAKNALRQTKPWVMLFMVLGCLGCLGPTLMLVLSLVAMATDFVPGAVMFLGSGLYLGMIGSITYLFYKYFDALNRFERSPNAGTLEKALVAQMNVWKFYGILVLIGVGLWLLLMLLMMALGFGGMMLRS